MSPPTAQPTAESPRRGRALALRCAVGLVCAALAAGLSFGGAHLFGPRGAAEPPRPAFHHAEPESLVDVADLMAARDFARGLHIARRAAAKLEGPRLAPALYRVALCEEGSGDYAAALRSYGELMSWRPAAALFGTARCQIRSKQYEQSATTLDRLESLTTHAALRELGISAEVSYWRAIRLLHSRHESKPEILDPRNVRSVEFLLPAHRYLRWGEVEGVSVSTGAESRRPTEPAIENNARIRDAIKLALAADHDHPFALPMRLELVNLDTADGPPAVAAWGYELLRSDESAGTLSEVLDYNLGLCWLRAGELGRARGALLQAIDRSSNDAIIGPAWWFVARTYLDAGDMTHAQRPLKHAASASNSRVRAAVAVAQAACHLLDGHDAEIHDVLAEASRADLRSPALRHETVLIDAFARYRLARQVRPQPAVQREDLLAALGGSRGANATLGPAMGLIRALACREMGLAARSAEALADALPAARGPLAGRIGELLADSRLEAGSVDDARALLKSLLAADEAPARSRARLKLARLELTAGRPTECLKLCRGWEPDDDNDRDSQLALMGHAYSALKDSRRAADCFAGRYPRD